MTRKRRRLYVVLLGLSTLAVAAALVLSAFEDNIVFFYSPTDIATKTPPPDRRVRIGGIVVDGSKKMKPDGITVAFSVTDGSLRAKSGGWMRSAALSGALA